MFNASKKTNNAIIFQEIKFNTNLFSNKKSRNLMYNTLTPQFTANNIPQAILILKTSPFISFRNL